MFTAILLVIFLSNGKVKITLGRRGHFASTEILLTCAPESQQTTDLVLNLVDYSVILRRLLLRLLWLSLLLGTLIPHSLLIQLDKVSSFSRL